MHDDNSPVVWWLVIAFFLGVANISSCNRRLSLETPPGSHVSGAATSLDVIIEHGIKALAWPVVAVVQTWRAIVDNSWEFDTRHRAEVDALQEPAKNASD